MKRPVSNKSEAIEFLNQLDGLQIVQMEQEYVSPAVQNGLWTPCIEGINHIIFFLLNINYNCLKIFFRFH